MGRILSAFLMLGISSMCGAQIYKYLGIEDGLSNRRIYRIQKDGRGYMWFLTQEGMDRYDGKRIRHYTVLDGNLKVAPQVNLNWLYTDTENTLWVVGRKGRIFHYDTLHDRFRMVYRIPGLQDDFATGMLCYAYMDRGDRIWLCQGDHIIRYDTRTGIAQRLVSRLRGDITAISETDGTNLFIGTVNGLFPVRERDGVLEALADTDSIRTPVSELYYHPGSKKLFVGTFRKGILVYGVSAGSTLRNVAVNRITPLNDRELLIATGGRGVYRMDMDSLVPKPYITADYASHNGMNGDNINDIYVDGGDRIWLANYPAGVTIRNNRYQSYEWFRHSPGNSRSLVNDQVHDVIEDSEGDLWFATSNGISLLQPAVGRWRSFLSRSDGIQDGGNHIFLTLCEVSPGVICAGGYASGLYRIEKKTGRLCQNADTAFFLCAKPRLSQARALLLPKVFVSLGIKFFVMAKLHFRPYIPNQTVLFPQRIDENIAANDPVRIVNAVIDNLNLESFKKLYKETGRCPYHPKMMLKVIIYAYMNNIYSCRKIEKHLLRDIHYIWLAGNEHPDFITINRFRNRVKEEINNVFTQLVLVLADKGFISLDVEYIDGTKIESKANKYTFVWRKTVERNRTRLMDKIRILLEQVDEAIVQENSIKDTSVEFTPCMLSDIVDELKEALERQPATKDKEEKKALRKKKKQVRELEGYRDKLIEYDNHLDTLGERNSYSKTDPGATFMRMKEDAMKNGQTKPGYNLQIGTENQFITDFRLFPNPTDTLTLIPFFHSFQYRYNRLPNICVADSGYGSEENYRFMQENGIEAFIKYNYFHKEQRPRYTPNPFHAESLHYNAQEDYYVCPMGQHMNRIGTKRDKTASGYITESARYKAKRCEGCPLRGSCFKARGNRIIEVNHRLNQYKRQARERLLSEEGIKHRGRRCIEPEAVFGQMKYNMAYRRFRHVGEDKVTMDFAFFAIAFNIKKMCAKLIKEGKGLITVAKYMFMGLFITRYNWNIATCCQMHEEKAA